MDNFGFQSFMQVRQSDYKISKYVKRKDEKIVHQNSDSLGRVKYKE